MLHKEHTTFLIRKLHALHKYLFYMGYHIAI